MPNADVLFCDPKKATWTFKTKMIKIEITVHFSN